MEVTDLCDCSSQVYIAFVFGVVTTFCFFVWYGGRRKR